MNMFEINGLFNLPTLDIHLQRTNIEEVENIKSLNVLFHIK